MSTVESWYEGYVCGLTWSDHWAEHPGPGGPWVHTCSKNPPCEGSTEAENEAWRDGWRAGIAEKHRRRAYNHDDDQHAGGFGDGRL